MKIFETDCIEIYKDYDNGIALFDKYKKIIFCRICVKHFVRGKYVSREKMFDYLKTNYCEVLEWLILNGEI